MRGFEVLQSDPTTTILGIKQTMVLISRGEPSVKLVEAGTRIVKERGQGHPQALLAVATEGSPAPNDELRQALNLFFQQIRASVRLFAVVIEGSGIVAIAKRTTLLALSQFIMGAVRFKVFSGVVNATEWLTQEAARLQIDCPSTQELRSLVEQYRQPGLSREAQAP